MSTIMAYQRANSDIGIRNHLLIIPTVICSNQVCSRIMQMVPDTVAIPHQHGCSQIGADKDRTFDVLAGTGKNPNVGWVIIISLGCEVVFDEGEQTFLSLRVVSFTRPASSGSLYDRIVDHAGFFLERMCYNSRSCAELFSKEVSRMGFDFDRIINRRNTYSYKWDQSEKLFGDKDILPLWVADMDFESPPAVKAALEKRASHEVYGYTIRSEGYINAIINWFAKRHDWEIKTSWITDSPSVVTSLSLAVELFSEPGSPVILQSPVYYPFYDVIRANGREVAKNPLVIKNGRFEMDYGHLEELMQGGARLMFLCSPHNPGGRVWERDELVRLGELCLKYGVIVVSDEIHCDLVFPGSKHIPFASISPEIAGKSLTLIAPTKTFNLPGLQHSSVITSNPEFKRKLDLRLRSLNLHMTNFFVPDFVKAAFGESEAWLDELLVYLQGNVDYAIRYLSGHVPQVSPMRPDGTYLLWVDCRNLNMDANGLKELMYKKAKVAFTEGSVFGTEGAGFLRINLACPRSILEEALERFARAVKEL